MLPPPSQLRDWHTERSAFFDRAAEDSKQAAVRFLEDWASESGIRLLSAPIPRVKSPERIWAKLLRKAARDSALTIASFDELLVSNSLVGDLVGVRFVVRGLSDLTSLLESMAVNGFMDDPPFVGRTIDDKNRQPSATGYRAVHVNAGCEVSIRAETLLVPVEVQIKTGLQDTWGTFTHDIAYARTDLHQDTQFVRLRELQRLLADSLDVADQLNRAVEEIYDDFVRTRLASDDAAALTVDGILNVLVELHETVVSVSDATRLVDTAQFCGVGTVREFRAIAEDQEALQVLAAEMERVDGSTPQLVDVIARAIERGLDRGT